MPRLKAKVDANQAEIVKTFRSLGASVCHLHQLGKGVPDLLVGYLEKNYLIEVKDGKKPPSKQKLTADERRFIDNWKGQVNVISSVSQARNFIFKINNIG